MEDFTGPQIARAAEEPGKYSAALVFSTKYDPPRPLLSLGPKSEALDEEFFGLHHDLPPEEIARQLEATLVWERCDQGHWVAPDPVRSGAGRIDANAGLAPIADGGERPIINLLCIFIFHLVQQVWHTAGGGSFRLRPGWLCSSAGALPAYARRTRRM